ncbi:hypothetical protein KSS93_18020 [Pseudomonas xanthosomatis]|uniref:hypothetical protein n=1 Tax=Pseudomonas xanthosomatis TaxID=2842356 RepID=UPI001C3C4255|nr:hypothetical protein [Pseudomonas xanthosomatis]QXH44775.1 hypothetical protein KSS93_18020 [Pseudomonas xanthosomatis]
MPKISISAASPTRNLAATKFLHKTLGCALASASRMLESGKASVFFTCQLFMNDHVEKDKKIRKIIDFFTKENIELCIVEIDDDANWSDVDFNNPGNLEISKTLLLNMLDEAKGRYR